ncbi:MAG: histidine phosphatase family protein [Myxococcales bacterium]|nr:histidine phosphatase family protein [Polyangiaceae bacterium]MDW8249410.1 histidine phosphatase family protein [Myxococcales bacterium]
MIFVRHAPVHAQGLCYGHFDPPVQMSHEHAAHQVLERLSEPGIQKVLSSPAGRCRGLALILAQRIGVPYAEDERLAELHQGQWEGRLWLDIEQQEPQALARWMKSWEREGPPGGESAQQLADRVRSYLTDHGDTHHLVVGHAGWIRAAWVLLEGLSWQEAMNRTVPHLAPIQLPVYLNL